MVFKIGIQHLYRWWIIDLQLFFETKLQLFMCDFRNQDVPTKVMRTQKVHKIIAAFDKF